MYKNFETNKFRCMINLNTGHILAYSKLAQHYKKELFLNNETNSFPCTDEDFIINKAKELIYK